jgi:hypothetical protein
VTAVVLAHAGHWLPQLLYLAPLLVLIVAIVVGRVRERRESRAAARRPESEPPDPTVRQ